MLTSSCCVLFFAIVSSTVYSVESHCSTNQRIVGLFKPLSYQDRAVQLAHNNRTSQICFEPFRPILTNVSETWQDVFMLLSGGLVALVTDQPFLKAVKDVIDIVKIPVVSTSIITMDTNSTVISTAPSEEQLANALSALIVYNSWTDVVLLTWQGSGIELFLPDSPSNYTVTAVYYIDTSDKVVRSKLIKIREDDDVIVIILHHYDPDKVSQIFKMAAEEGLNIYPYVWILLGNTAEMLVNGISNGNAVSYIPRLLAVYPVISNFSSNQQLMEFTKTWQNYGSVKQLQSAAYLYDAFSILLDAIDDASLTIPNFTQIQQSCGMLQEWQHGRTFQAILKEKSNNKRLTTGDIAYHYFSIDQNGFNKIATWTGGEDFKFNNLSSIRWCSQQEFIRLRSCQGDNTLRCNKKFLPPRAPPTSAYQFDYSRYTFDVVTIESASAHPFVFITTDDDGRKVYEGLCIDLMDKLSEVLGFTYTISIVEDGRYGGQDEDGNWMGLVGDLVNREAEIALAPLTITSSRGNVIDFTKAYYDVGKLALFSITETNSGPNQLAFLKPFDTSLWLLALASIIIVSVGVAITGRLSPYDWYQNPPDHLPLWEARFQMTVFNSIWQSLTAVLQQGAETAPQSTSGRILMGGWWFVCVMLATAYTANLTALFATNDNNLDIPRTINELISKIPPNIEFGAINNTHTTEYLQHSPLIQYQEAFQYMKMEGFLYETRDEALKAVLYENIALLVDSPLVDYLVSRRGPYNPDCTLTSIGDGMFSPSGYGLALTKNSPFTEDFSLAILELRGRGEIDNLRDEYFNYQRTCTSEIAMASASAANMDTEQINLEAFGGLFVLLGIGIIISLLVLLAEHTFKRRKKIKATIVEKFHKCHEEKIASLSDSQEEMRTSTEL